MTCRSKLMGVLCAIMLVFTVAKADAADKPSSYLGDVGSFSANVAVTTDYVFRGISQSLNDPAAQAGIDWTLKDFFYVGVWTSTINFGAGRAPFEVDVYAGITPSLGGISFNFGGIYYIYPGATDAPGAEFNFFEGAGSAEYDFKIVKLKAAVNVSPDYFGESGDAVFAAGTLTIPVPQLPLGFEVSGTIGRQWIEKNAAFGTPDYTTWNVGASVTIGKFTLDVRYHDTNISKTGCFGGPAGPNLCATRVVGTLSGSF